MHLRASRDSCWFSTWDNKRKWRVVSSCYYWIMKFSAATVGCPKSSNIEIPERLRIYLGLSPIFNALAGQFKFKSEISPASVWTSKTIFPFGRKSANRNDVRCTRIFFRVFTNRMRRRWYPSPRQLFVFADLLIRRALSFLKPGGEARLLSTSRLESHFRDATILITFTNFVARLPDNNGTPERIKAILGWFSHRIAAVGISWEEKKRPYRVGLQSVEQDYTEIPPRRLEYKVPLFYGKRCIPQWRTLSVFLSISSSLSLSRSRSTRHECNAIKLHSLAMPDKHTN